MKKIISGTELHPKITWNYLKQQLISFEISREVPNSETLEAIREVEEMKKNPSFGKSYTDIDKMMEEMLSWDIS